MKGGKAGKPAGLPKSGGRQKGTPNRRTQLLRDLFADLGYDPFRKLIQISQNPGTSDELRVRIDLEMCAYIHAKLKPVEEAITEPTGLDVVTKIAEVQAPDVRPSDTTESNDGTDPEPDSGNGVPQ